jgi:hypothetical protein
VAVRDSGIGIDSESAERLFNAFLTTKPSSMGMGLSNQPFDHKGPRSQIVGIAKCGPRRSFSIYRTD